jgi:hypothetical protein
MTVMFADGYGRGRRPGIKGPVSFADGQHPGRPRFWPTRGPTVFAEDEYQLAELDDANSGGAVSPPPGKSVFCGVGGGCPRQEDRKAGSNNVSMDA